MSREGLRLRPSEGLAVLANGLAMRRHLQLSCRSLQAKLEVLKKRTGQEKLEASQNGVEQLALLDQVEQLALEDGVEQLALQDGVEQLALQGGVEQAALLNEVEDDAGSACQGVLVEGKSGVESDRPMSELQASGAFV